MRLKPTVVATLALVGLGAAGLASAATSPLISANNEVGVAVTGTNTNYLENITPGPSDSETGFTPGFALKGSYLGNIAGLSDVYAQVKYQRTMGDLSYKGAVGNTPEDGTDSMNMNRVTARLGMAFPVADDMLVIPYLTGGYQNWNRSLQGPYGYNEFYSAGLVGAGAKFEYAMSPRMVFGARAEMLAVVDGGMTPSDVPGIPNGVLGSASFDTTGEEVVGVDADYRIAGPVHLYGGLDYTHFDYSGGALNGGFAEPSSQTNQFGVDLGVAYGF